MSQILLTTQQIFEIANFAGLGVSLPNEDEKDIDYILDDDMTINVFGDDDKRGYEYKGLGIYSSEYPEEGALPLSNLEKLDKNLRGMKL